jgi:hypothetical protein
VKVVEDTYSMNKHIRYGDYECANLHQLCGLQDPLVIRVIERIKELDWSGFQLWAHGSILNTTGAKDIDLTIIGPNDAERINYLLEQCVKIGFDRFIQVDIKYLVKGKLYDHTKGIAVTQTLAHYRPEIWINGQTYTYAHLKDDLWQSQRKFPMNKSERSPHPPKQLI